MGAMQICAMHAWLLFPSVLNCYALLCCATLGALHCVSYRHVECMHINSKIASQVALNISAFGAKTAFCSLMQRMPDKWGFHITADTCATWYTGGEDWKRHDGHANG